MDSNKNESPNRDNDDSKTDKQDDLTSIEKEDITPNEMEEIKSTAPKPAQFMKLNFNTDLKMPPNNWLSDQVDFYGLQDGLCHRETSSFRTAHAFPDYVSEVDVISNAENIKNFLKIPYVKGPTSMIIHRLENTLLLDNFDFYKHLSRNSKYGRWLKKFFLNASDSEKTLVLKFLYNSLALHKEDSDDLADDKIPELEDPLLTCIKRPLFEPSSPSDSDKSMQFDNRNVMWTFEDTEKLIGTDLPIFGKGIQPCMSLRLRDVTKPINVLTGIDYWLDSLMSNVPEVVMRYHLNDFVQKYEQVKREYLPCLINSKFSSELIREVAQNILSFLNFNATRPGHTYWLFKGKDEDTVKLYDLTSVCSENDVKESQNPFTVSVAVLLYRVARNIKPTSSDRGATVRMLLRYCIQLLPEEPYPEIVTSSHYMLADLYIPRGTVPESQNFEQFDGQDSDSDLDREKKKFDKPPPITGTVEERCQQALSHLAAGLNSLKYFPLESAKAEENNEHNTEVPIAKPFVPVPQPELSHSHQKNSNKKHKYKNKRKNKKCRANLDGNKTNSFLLKNQQQAQRLPTWQYGNEMPNISWKEHLKTLLYEKAVLVYANLSEFHFRAASYGNSLRTIGLLARCHLVLRHLPYATNSLREDCLLGRVGDCAIMVVQNWNNIDCYREQYHNNTVEDLKIIKHLHKDERFYGISIGKSNMKCVFLHTLKTQEQMIFKAVECYEESLKCSEDEACLRRLGNALNEIGTLYLDKAKAASVSKTTIEMCKKAESFIQRGINIFEKINDAENTALLYTNMGQMQRLLVRANTDLDEEGLTPSARLQFNKAILSYKKALLVLVDRQHYPLIWDTVNWELSTTLFNMSTMMIEICPSKSGGLELKRMIEFLQRALDFCDLDQNNPKFLLYRYRAATIHLRLGTLYHNEIASSGSVVHKKNIIHLAKDNYDTAAKYYFRGTNVIIYLSTKLRRVELSQFLYENATTPNLKIKHLQDCISVLVSMNEMLKLVVETDKSTELSFLLNDTYFSSLLNLIRTQLHNTLKPLIKLCQMKPSPNKDCPQLANIYKECYTSSFDLVGELGVRELVSRLHNVLEKINDQVANIEITD